MFTYFDILLLAWPTPDLGPRPSESIIQTVKQTIDTGDLDQIKAAMMLRPDGASAKELNLAEGWMATMANFDSPSTMH